MFTDTNINKYVLLWITQLVLGPNWAILFHNLMFNWNDTKFVFNYAAFEMETELWKRINFIIAHQQVFKLNYRTNQNMPHHLKIFENSLQRNL